MVELEDIIEAYYDCRKNKRKSADQVEFELHWEMNCVKLWNDVNNFTVKPSAYTFVTLHPRPREVFASDFATRILHHYLDIRLKPILEKRFTSHTFNNRAGMGQMSCQNAVISDIYEVSEGFTKDAWVIKLDMKGCFPNINQDIAFNLLKNIILEDYVGPDKDSMIEILLICIYSHPTSHCKRKGNLKDWELIPPEKSLFTKPENIGAAIGFLIWQITVNVYFDFLDKWFEENGIVAERYVDDTYIITDNKEMTLLMIPEIRRKLATVGARLNEKKFYCQHISKGVECLGAHIKMDRIYVNNRIIANAKQSVRRHNRKVDENHLDKMLSSVNSYLGVCKNVNGYNQVMQLIRLLSPEWYHYMYFNRRRVCLSPLPQYTQRNRIIHKFNLK